jgi:transposase
MDMRELKGLEIAARCRVGFRDGAWIVPSQSGSGSYRVLLLPQGDSCPCDDFQLTQKPCKHVHAARIIRERDFGGKAPALDTDTVPKRPTYKQNWPAYNLAQNTEKHRFQELLSDLCRGIEEPAPVAGKRGRKPHLLRDCVFSATLKVYSTFSTRRFQCDLSDAHGEGYLTADVPSMKICEFLQNPALTPILQRMIVRTSLPLKTVETVFAPDSTGFSVSRFVRWFDEKYGRERSGKDYVKAHAICGVKTNIVTAVEVAEKTAGDSPMFKPLVEATARNFAVKEVPADKAYLSHDNLALVDGLGGTAFVPFKSNSLPGEAGTLWQSMYHYFQFRREEFLQHYHQRSNAESTFSAIKRKFGDAVRSKDDTAMRNEVFCKFLCHNICCNIMEQCVLGIDPVFWPKEAVAEPDAGRDVLRFPAG